MRCSRNTLTAAAHATTSAPSNSREAPEALMFTAAQVRTKLAVVTRHRRDLVAAFLALAIPVPAFFAAKAPIHAVWAHILAALAITAVACLAASRLASRVTAIAGGLAVAVCVWLLTV